MMMKPPVVFGDYPARSEDWSGPDDVMSLWAEYACNLISDAEPCMEANEGALQTISLLACYGSMSGLSVARKAAGIYQLVQNAACLLLRETVDGSVYLHIGSEILDLSYYSSDTAAYFIATVFGAYSKVAAAC